MIVRASVDVLGPKFRNGLVTSIFTAEDAARMAELAAQQPAERGVVAVVR